MCCHIPRRRNPRIFLSFFPTMEAKQQKPETAEIRVSYAGEVIDLAGIGVYMRHDLDELRKEVEAKKIEIRCVLPRTFRDAVTMEERLSTFVVFSIPVEVARQYSLIED